MNQGGKLLKESEGGWGGRHSRQRKKAINISEQEMSFLYSGRARMKRWMKGSKGGKNQRNGHKAQAEDSTMSASTVAKGLHCFLPMRCNHHD